MLYCVLLRPDGGAGVYRVTAEVVSPGQCPQHPQGDGHVHEGNFNIPQGQAGGPIFQQMAFAWNQLGAERIYEPGRGLHPLWRRGQHLSAPTIPAVAAGVLLALFAWLHDRYIPAAGGVLLPTAMPASTPVDAVLALVGYLLLMCGLYFWPWFLRRPRVQATRFSSPLSSFFPDGCIRLSVGDGGDGTLHIDGTSAGLAFFLAAACAVFKGIRCKGDGWLVPEWGTPLLSDDHAYLASAIVEEGAHLNEVGGWDRKLGAVCQFNSDAPRRIRHGLCARPQLAPALPNQPLPRVETVYQCDPANQRDDIYLTGHASIGDVLRSLGSPVQSLLDWRLIAAVAVPGLIMFSSLLVEMPRTTAPEFTVESQQCRRLVDRVVRCPVLPGGLDTLTVEVAATGYGEHLALWVATSGPAALMSWGNGHAQSLLQEDIGPREKRATLTFIMPEAMGSGHVLVTVSMKNDAGRWSPAKVIAYGALTERP